MEGGWIGVGGTNTYFCLICLFVLRFYGPFNPVGSCRVQSVYLTTRLLGRLSLCLKPMIKTQFNLKGSHLMKIDYLWLTQHAG